MFVLLYFESFFFSFGNLSERDGREGKTGRPHSVRDPADGSAAVSVRAAEHFLTSLKLQKRKPGSLLRLPGLE